MIALIEERKAEIAALCRQYGVRWLDLFGSAADGTFNEETSDLDFLVDFADHSPGYAWRWLEVEEKLSALLGRSVDLVIDDSIENPYFRRAVDRHRIKIYERTGREAAA